MLCSETSWSSSVKISKQVALGLPFGVNAATGISDWVMASSTVAKFNWEHERERRAPGLCTE